MSHGELLQLTGSRCVVCGNARVRSDEVMDRGLIRLSECPNCQHRTTRRLSWWDAPWPGAAMARAEAAVEEEFAAA